MIHNMQMNSLRKPIRSLYLHVLLFFSTSSNPDSISLRSICHMSTNHHTIHNTTTNIQCQNNNTKTIPKMPATRAKMFWSPREDRLLISRLHIAAYGFRSRGSQSWKDIAATMTKQAPGYGVPVQTYDAEMVQARWYELRPQYERQVVEEEAAEIQANRDSLVLAPLREEFKTEMEPERKMLDRAAAPRGPPGFEELCNDRKDRKGKGRER
jgi:hypothetical protein